MNKFEGVRIFSSGLDKSFVETGMAVIINNSLARHVSKVEEVLGCLILVQLLFKGKLLVTFVGLYAGLLRGTLKVIDFIFVSNNLASAVALHFVNEVSELFDTDHKSISVSVGLDGLLNTCLNSAQKQANKDW
ncbi:hypothetical protein G9A89_005831 [Geosiphon pyriformis]|nr:hypothetical protein G9A89_005831 [Geosiphon pyriformis]